MKIAVSIFIASSSTVLCGHAFAQEWTEGSQGVFIYGRDVPPRPAQIPGEPAPPDQLILSGPNSPFDPLVHLSTMLSDAEAGQISASIDPAISNAIGNLANPDSDPSAYANRVSSIVGSVTAETQGGVGSVVNQATGLIGQATSTIGAVLGNLPRPGGP